MTLPFMFSHLGIVNNGHRLKSSLVYELIVGQSAQILWSIACLYVQYFDESVRLVIGDGIFLEVIISWT